MVISLLVLLLLACGTSCGRRQGSPAAAGGDLLVRVKEQGRLVIATEGTWAPWTYHDEKGKLAGFDIEVAQRVARRLGVTAEFVETEWDGIFTGVDSGSFDIAFNGIAVTDARLEKYGFSIPYGYVRTAIITLQSSRDINGFEDLKDMITANSPGSNYAKIAESYGAKVRSIESFEGTIQLLTQGKIDATLNADASFYEYMKGNPDARIKIAALSPDVMRIAAVVRKADDSDGLIAAVNQALQEMLLDGEISRISQKYFGGDITIK